MIIIITITWLEFNYYKKTNMLLSIITVHLLELDGYHSTLET